jgi:hypothetical protein
MEEDAPTVKANLVILLLPDTPEERRSCGSSVPAAGASYREVTVILGGALLGQDALWRKRNINGISQHP